MTKNGEPERQGYHHGDLRRALLEAAEVELAEKGPEGFTLRGCAKRAGVSHAAPAHHFGDVSGLLSALAAEGFERFLKTTAARMNTADPGDSRARLVAMGLGYIDFARANPALFSLMFSSRKADFQDGKLQQAAAASFEQLVAGVGGCRRRPVDDTARKAAARRHLGHRARPVAPAAFPPYEIPRRPEFRGTGKGSRCDRFTRAELIPSTRRTGCRS